MADNSPGIWEQRESSRHFIFHKGSGGQEGDKGGGLGFLAGTERHDEGAGGRVRVCVLGVCEA